MDDVPFVIGQLVGTAEGDGAVQIRIDRINEDRSILTTVVKLGDFYSAKHLTGNQHGTDSVGFVLDETLKFKAFDTWWIIDEPANRPWHVLEVRADGPHFEHYR
jgi:hypothetical protein